jgi:STAM-binding protein
MVFAAFCIAILPLAPALIVPRGKYQTVWLDEKKFPDAKCLDGTQGAFVVYLPEQKTDKWLFFLEGGGWCMDLKDCYTRSTGYLGTSSGLPDTLNSHEAQLSNDCDINPEFCAYNKVRFHYCDGNSFISNNPDGVVVPSSITGGEPKTIFFKGASILKAAMDFFREDTDNSLSDATDVLLTGCSAGGLATFLNSDRLMDNYFNRKDTPNLIRFKAMPISGFFLDQKTVFNENFYPGYMKVIHDLSKAAVPDRCAKAIMEKYRRDDIAFDMLYLCNFAEKAFATTVTPTFFVNSAIDSWQLSNIFTNQFDLKYTSYHDCVADIEKCNSTYMGAVRNFEDTFMMTLNRGPAASGYKGSQHGAFISSCQSHCEAQDVYFWQNLTTVYKDDAVKLRDAFLKWWNSPEGTRQPEDNFHHEPCEVGGLSTHQCNPRCFAPKRADFAETELQRRIAERNAHLLHLETRAVLMRTEQKAEGDPTIYV